MRNVLLEVEVPPHVAGVGEYTPDDLLTMEDGDYYELVDGKLVERNMGARSSEVAANFITRLKIHVEPGKLGKVFSNDCGYQIFADAPKKVRRPDASLVLAGRFPDDKSPEGYVKIAPDLAVEVVSPNDLAEEVEVKRVEWLRAGVRLLWIAYPSTRCVHRHRPDGSASVFGPDGELSGEDVLSGFTCKVAAVFA